MSGGGSKQLHLTVKEHPVELKYDLLSTVGAGSYGKAVLATRKADGEKVVVKQIFLRDLDDKAREEALHEARLLAQFDHINIVHYYECVLEDGCLNIVMEYASEGELADVIAKRAADKKPFTEDDIMFWFVQIVLALYHVHSKSILHRDLKSQNIFISEGNIIKLGDFGIARVLNSDTELARTVIGTPYYLSPELCEDRPYNRKSDVWALGCVLYELCTLKRAFDGQSLPALVVKILKGKYPPVPTRYCSHLRGLVDSMLKQNPKERPSVDAILRQSYVKGHVERYAQHVMALSPLQPVALGIEVGAEAASQGQGAGSGGGAGGTPSRTGSGETRARAGSNPPRPSAVAGAGSPAPASRMRASVAAHSPAAPAVRASAAAPPAAAAAAAPVAAEAVTEAPAPRAVAAAAAASHSPASKAAAGAAGHGADAGGFRGVAPPPLAEPGAVGLVGKKLPANGRLVGSTWMRHQHAALSELEQQLGGMQGRAGAGGVRASQQQLPPGAGAAAGAAGLEELPPLDPGLPPPLHLEVRPTSAQGGNSRGGAGSGGGAGGAMEGSMAGGVGSASMARARLLEVKAAQREAELEANKAAVAQERERKKIAASKRSIGAAEAVRARVVERQREVERNLAEQRAKEEEKAKKASELAAQLQNKKESQAKLREQIASHMAAHAQQVKAARPRVNREELAKLGAEFAARQLQLGPAGGHGAGAGAAGTSSPAGPSVLLVNVQREDSGGGAKGGAGGAGAAAAVGNRGTPSKLGAPGVRAAGAAGAAAGGRQAGGAAGQSPVAEPPWRAAKAAVAALPGRAGGGFPEVQIFTPFGSEITPPATPPDHAAKPGSAGKRPPAASPSPRGHGLPLPLGPGARAGAAAAAAVVNNSPSDKAVAAWAKRGKGELLQVLSQIQDVLAAEEDEEEEEGEEEQQGPAAAAAGPQGGRPSSASSSAAAAGAGQGGLLGRPPQPGPPGLPKPSPARPAHHGGVRGGAGGPGAGGALALPPEQEDASSAAARATKVEQLRMSLERDLGPSFLSAYRYLRQVQQEAVEKDEDSAAAPPPPHQQQAMLERLLGKQVHYARQIHKLITLEDSVFD